MPLTAEHAEYCEEIARQRGLPAFPDAPEADLVEVTLDHHDDDRPCRTVLVHRETAQAWARLKAAALDDGVTLQLVSAFRSRERQEEIIAGKVAGGRLIEEILTANAPPGYSEHHSGRALDVTTPGCPALEEAFEETAAFRWLQQHASPFGFRLSYPRGNPHGFIYEPWHWFHREISDGQDSSTHIV